MGPYETGYHREPIDHVPVHDVNYKLKLFIWAELKTMDVV